MKKVLGYTLLGGLLLLVFVVIVGVLLAPKNLGSSYQSSNSPPQSLRPALASGWSEGISDSDLMEHNVTVFFVSQSDLDGSKLIVNCHSKKPPEILVTLAGEQPEPELGLYNENTVKVRFDDAGPRRERWSESTDNHALFSEVPVRLVKHLFKANDFYSQYQKFASNAVTTHFKVDGLKSFLLKHAECAALLK